MRVLVVVFEDDRNRHCQGDGFDRKHVSREQEKSNTAMMVPEYNVDKETYERHSDSGSERARNTKRRKDGTRRIRNNVACEGRQIILIESPEDTVPCRPVW
jgi:hypothetical protein